MERYGTHFVHASDEWYILAERELPEEDSYDGYIQLENGVGMIRLLENEFSEALEELCGRGRAGGASLESSGGGLSDAAGESSSGEKYPEGELPDRSETHVVSLATGLLAAPFLRQMAEKCMREFPNYRITVYPIRNEFFGERITVSGLLTGQDIRAQLSGEKLGERLLLPCNLLRSGEEVFLDDMTLTELKTALQVDIDIVKSSGQDLLYSMLGMA